MILEMPIVQLLSSLLTQQSTYYPLHLLSPIFVSSFLSSNLFSKPHLRDGKYMLSNYYYPDQPKLCITSHPSSDIATLLPLIDLGAILLVK